MAKKLNKSTKIKKINDKLAEKYGDKNIELYSPKRTNLYFVTGKFFPTKVELRGPSDVNYWSVDYFILEINKIYESKYARKINELNEMIDKTIRLIARIKHAIKNHEKNAEKFKRSIGAGLTPYSGSASRLDLRKKLTTETAGVICDELLEKVKNFRVNQKNSIDLIYRILYNLQNEIITRNTIDLIKGDIKMAKKKVAKKKVAKKKTTTTKATNITGESINELLAQLEAAEDQLTKRQIRSKLRARGHRGGLQGSTTKKSATKKKVAKKKVSKKKVALVNEKKVAKKKVAKKKTAKKATKK